VVKCPIPSTDHASTFIEKEVPNLWTYYCTGQHKDVSNRFVSMPGQRTRVLGTQLFKYNIKGFLQWGFNFWYSQFSIHDIDPYVDTSADYFVLCTGNSSTQVKALAGEVEYKLEERGITPYNVEGRGNDTWGVVDYSSVVVHIFSREARDFYNLDKLYGDEAVLTFDN
jgi:ribosome silencing factor RsfS/YbeB/iojap